MTEQILSILVGLVALGGFAFTLFKGADDKLRALERDTASVLTEIKHINARIDRIERKEWREK